MCVYMCVRTKNLCHNQSVPQVNLINTCYHTHFDTNFNQAETKFSDCCDEIKSVHVINNEVNIIK